MGNHIHLGHSISRSVYHPWQVTFLQLWTLLILNLCEWRLPGPIHVLVMYHSCRSDLSRSVKTRSGWGLNQPFVGGCTDPFTTINNSVNKPLASAHLCMAQTVRQRYFILTTVNFYKTEILTNLNCDARKDKNHKCCE